MAARVVAGCGDLARVEAALARAAQRQAEVDREGMGMIVSGMSSSLLRCLANLNSIHASSGPDAHDLRRLTP